MKQKIIFSTSLLILLCSGWLVIKAQSTDYTKHYSEKYSVNANTRLEIQNQFGNVDIKDWDQNSISIEVKIIVKSSNKEKADKILEYISVNFSEQDNLIKAVTEIDENFSKKFNWGNSMNDKNIEINYSVNMPKTVPLDLYVKYGNAFINELVSTTNIEIKYGNLKAHIINSKSEKPLSTITLAYSNATVDEGKWLKLNLKYSKIEITKSKALVVLSKYSKVFGDVGSSIVSESKYDTYQIGKLNNFVTTSAYSNFKFDEVTDKLIMETAYSDVKIGYMPPEFEEIKIENRYGNYKIGVDKNASYKINGEANYAKIYIPDSGKVNRIQENTEMKVYGIVGDNEKTTSKVSITTKYGSVKLID
ncbi:MAG: hypothetical protein JXJ22_09240 [Bacteroidales bacterium]|nr:hypothetical protein [Bacteroidales bacterium]